MENFCSTSKFRLTLQQHFRPSHCAAGGCEVSAERGAGGAGGGGGRAAAGGGAAGSGTCAGRSGSRQKQVAEGEREETGFE